MTDPEDLHRGIVVNAAAARPRSPPVRYSKPSDSVSGRVRWRADALDVSDVDPVGARTR